MKTLRTSQPVDVMLLLEGTYPFVRGGVSAWVHRLIEEFPQTRFGIVLLGGLRSEHGAPAYDLPPNVVHFERHYLFEPQDEEAQPRWRAADDVLAEVDRLYAQLRICGAKDPLDVRLVERVARSIGEADGLSRSDFLRGDAAWQRIVSTYRRDFPDASFTDYFWTVRATHASLFTLASIARRLPPARFYHSLSTGYAGLLGALLRYRQGRALVVTEHGIYTKERMIDLASAERFPGDGACRTLGPGRRMWIRFFQALGKIAYSSAHSIIALYEGNRKRQIDDGADPRRTRVIPNGVDVDRFAKLRSLRPSHPPPVIGFVGRVVPIKDVKTFVRSIKSTVGERPDIEGWIVGPDSEDEAYAKECRQLVSSLGLVKNVKFLGFQRPEEILPRLGLLVLTSISEALPLVVLEAFASGLPVLTTDVGACRELIEGRTEQDRALGAAGAVVPIASPEATAAAALALLRDDARWQAAQRAAVGRAQTHYRQDQMIEAYRQIYAEAFAWPA